MSQVPFVPNPALTHASVYSPNARALAGHLEEAIDTYRQAHPQLHDLEVRQALHLLQARSSTGDLERRRWILVAALLLLAGLGLALSYWLAL